jgi:hypothetical protein
MILRVSLIASWLVLVSCASLLNAQEPDTKGKPETGRATLSLRASPVSGLAPLRVQLTGELKGGRDDDEELYCSAVEWAWGDGTISESAADCEPFEAGKSSIRRRYTVQHVYQEPGHFQVYLRLKKKNRTLTSASATVQIVGERLPD